MMLERLSRLGLLKLQSGEIAAAREILEQAITIAPNSAAARFHLGLAEDNAGAIHRFAEALVLEPAFIDALHVLGAKQAEAEAWSRALRILRRGAALAPGRDDLRVTLDRAVLIASRAAEHEIDTDQATAPLPPRALRRPLAVALIDPIGWDYDVATPLKRPLGGSQSALCYLSLALAKAGHRVTTLTGTKQPRAVGDVDCRNLAQGAEGTDIAILLNAPAAGPLWRRQLPANCRLVLWTQHAPDQPAMRALDLPAVRGAYDEIVCVSDWHRAATQLRFGAMPVAVMRNGIGPKFAHLFRDAKDLAEAKAGPPVLIYSSTPFRGLDVLLSAFPELRANTPDLRLDIYSSLKVYQAEGEDPHEALYAKARALDGVRHLGSIGQDALAAAMIHAHGLSYPNHFPETSCIAVMEALAAGLSVTTSRLAALPETAIGLARLVELPRGPYDPPAYQRAFIAAQTAALDERSSAPTKWAEAQFEQAKAAASAFAWDRRAREWEELLYGLVLPR